MMQQFIDLANYLSYITVYPYAKEWNVFNFILFSVFWVLVPFTRLRLKLGIVFGAFFSFILAFAWISVMDEIDVFMNFSHYLRFGWGFGHFYYRWSWKLFFGYFAVKYAKVYGIWGDLMNVSRRTILAITAYLSYWIGVVWINFSPYNYHSYNMTIYPRWFMYVFGNCVVWIMMTIVYLSFWKLRK